VCIFHFPRFLVFLTIFQVKQCFCLIFHIFQIYHHIPGPTLCIFIFQVFQNYLPYFTSYSVYFLFPYFQFYCHIPGPRVFESHFPRLSLFSLYSIFLQYDCLIFPVSSIFSPYTDPTVYISHFSHFSLLLVMFQVLPCEFLGLVVGHFSRHIQGLQCLHLIFHVFQFSHHIPGQTVFVSHFPLFFKVSQHIHILEFVFLIFLVFHFSCHIPGSTVCISHFSRFFFCVACHTSCPTECVSHFHDFQFSLHTQRPRVYF